MKTEKMTYSWNKLYTCADMVKATTWTVKKKTDHWAKYQEIEGLYRWAAENLNQFIFDPDFQFYMAQYRKAAFDYKSYTKADLDKKLRWCEIYIKNTLNEIARDIRSGEVNGCD